MNERNAIREQLYGVNSHVHLLHALEGLPAEHAGRTLAGLPHSIFQNVHHMVFWQDMALARLRDEHPAFPASASESWIERTAPESENDWQAAIASLAEGLRSFEALIADDGYDLDRVVDSRRDGTAREEIFWVQGHNSYHLGQIVLLREAFEAWPPPRGGDTW